MTRLFKRLLTKKRNKEGSEAVGTALSVVLIFLLVMIPIGLFIYLMPRITLEQDVQQFANSVRLDGYVASDVYGQFKDKMIERGYTEQELAINHNSSDWLKVYATDIPAGEQGGQYINGRDLIQTSANSKPPVISRGKGKIAIEVVLPANSGVFARAVKQIDTTGESDTYEHVKDNARYYKVSRVIMSEAYTIPEGG